MKNEDARDFNGLEIAVIGMSGRFPGAKNIDEFWENIKNGIESIRFFTDEEIKEEGIQIGADEAQRVVKAGGVLEGIEYFDSGFFEYTRSEADVLDPQIRVLEECAWEALETAGYNPDTYEGKIGVFVGASQNLHWQYRTLLNAAQNLSGQFAMLQLNNKDFMSTQLCYKLNLQGPGISINTACSTSLVTIDMACKSLLTADCDMAVAGGVSISLPQKKAYIYEEGMILSPDGHCRAFDKDANGTVPGNGAGIVVLKRLEDAIEDGDNIVGIIKASAVNNDGRRKVGYTTPSIEGQREVIQRALIMSGIEPEDIGYIEAHGTGTSLGDPIEIEALRQAFNTKKTNYCAIGSVKTNIGHLDAAAGVAGFIKTVLALRDRKLPPSLNYKGANPKIDFQNSPFFVNAVLKSWNGGRYPLRAGVSSFGIGGTNAHIILEEPLESRSSCHAGEWEIATLSAKNQSALERMEQNLADHLRKQPGTGLGDLCFTLCTGRKQFECRKAYLFNNRDDLIHYLSEGTCLGSGHTREIEKKRTAFVFQGYGTAYKSPGLALYRKEPVFRKEMDRCFAAVKEKMGVELKEIVYTTADAGEWKQAVSETEVGYLVLFSYQYALGKLLLELGVRPDYVIARGIGEYVAASLSGALHLNDALTLARIKGRLAHESRKMKCPLPISADIMLEVEKIQFSAPRMSYFSLTASKEVYEADMRNPGYWMKTLQANEEGATGLSGILGRRDTVYLEMEACRLADECGAEGRLDVVRLTEDTSENAGEEYLLLKALGRLWENGADIAWTKFYHGKEKRYRIPLPTYPFERMRHWIDDSRVNGAVIWNAGESRQDEGKKIEASADIEDELCRLWESITGMNGAAAEDDLFDIGGDSLKLIRLSTDIKQKLGVSVPLQYINDYPTLKSIGKYIRKAAEPDRDEVTYPSIKKDPGKLYEPFPLTEIQMAYLAGRSTAFELGNISTHTYTELRARIDIERFNKSIQKVIERHPMLRAVILPNGKQKILESVPPFVIEVIDLTDKEEPQQNAAILRERERMSHYVFKTDNWPLFEIKAARLGEGEYCLFVGIDMLIADASSMGIIGREIMGYYRNPDLKLPGLKTTFRDYMLAYQEMKKSKLYKRDKEHWLKKLASFPTAPDIPLKKKPSKVGKPYFKRLKATIGKERWEEIKRLLKSKGLTPSAVMLTGYAAILGHWSNQPELSVSMTVFNRFPFNEEVYDIVGDFTSVILIDIDLKRNKNFFELAVEVQKRLIEALEYRHYDGVEFIREIAARDNLGNKAAMPVIFTSMLFNEDTFDSEDNGMEHDFTVNRTSGQGSQIYLDNQASDQGGFLTLVWDYVEEIFDSAMMDRMFNQYVNIIGNLDDKSINTQLNLEDETKAVYDIFNATEKPIEACTLQGLFLKQVGINPNRTALVYQNKKLSYAQLNERADTVAGYLREKGAVKGNYIAVLGSRCIQTVVNILGVLKAGCAYVPIEPANPEDRINYIMDNSNCKLVLTPDWNPGEDFAAGNRGTEADCSPDDAAYVIYTSGSTGVPKGVIITHRSATNTIADINRRFEVNGEDRILGVSSFGFDLSVYDIFGPLSTGAALVIADNPKDSRAVAEIIAEQKVTIWNSVPAVMELLMDYLEENMDNADIKRLEEPRLVLLSGDWIALDLPGRINKYFKEARTVSLGGATEASIWSIYYEIKNINKVWKSIPYGKPLANQKIYVLNYQNKLCPVGVTGELFIGGEGVAAGYLNDSEKTKAAFIEDHEFGRLYRTGDFGVMHPQGYIELLGRKDLQVKIKGYRIELGEIEDRLKKHESIKNAVVVSRTDKKGMKYLCAYLAMDRDITHQEIKNYLSEYLPEYMIPLQIIKMERLPLTANGKIERESLPLCDFEPLEEIRHEPPSNETEKALVNICSELLDIENIGTNNNLYEMGAHSVTAVMLVSRVEREFGIEIPLDIVLKMQTIKEIAKYIGTVNRYLGNMSGDRDVTLLNGKTERSIFLFPPIAGLGVFYRRLPEHLSGYAIYAFDYIEHDNRINAYVDSILSIQDDGPYVLMGCSSGGNLGYEVAKELYKRGKRVSDIIMVDSLIQYDISDTGTDMYSEADVEVMLKIFLKGFEDYKEGLIDISPFLKKVAVKANKYRNYIKNIVLNEKIPVNIHLIKSQDKIDESRYAWEIAVNGKVKRYDGVGLHIEMLTKTECMRENVRIIDDILKEVFA